LQAVLNRFRLLAPGWSSNAKLKLETIVKAADGKLSGDVIFLLNELDNLLKQEQGYVRSSEEVKPSGDNIGESIQHFIKLGPLRPTPAPPDLSLNFISNPIPSNNRWDFAIPVWLTESPTPFIFVLNSREVRRIDSDDNPMLFPGGPAAIA